MSGQKRCRRRPAILTPPVVSLLLLVAIALPAAGQPPRSGPAVPPGAPVVPDTLTVRFAWDDRALPAPVALRVVPSVVALGEFVAVVVDGAGEAPLPDAEALRVDVDWLVPAPRPADAEAVQAAVAALPAVTGPRLVTFWRVYTLAAWRAVWDDGQAGDGPAAGVVTVVGRLAGGEPIMPVRDPRLPGGLPRWLAWLLVAALLTALAVLGWRRRRRRGAARFAEDQPLPPLAWLRAAVDLQALVATGADGRLFLDQLATILRRYVQDRFFLPAVAMTVAELAAAARTAGWRDEQLAGFLAILTECDRLRYAPPQVSQLACRDSLAAALACLERARVAPVWSPVAAPELAAATAAWDELCARRQRAGAVTVGGGAC